MSHPVPFMKASGVAAPKGLVKTAPDLEEAIEEDETANVAEPAEAQVDDEVDIKGDKYIKQPKQKAKGGAKKAAKASNDDGDEADKPAKAAKGRPKGKAAAAGGGRGKGKK